jgi:hypothetical protein
VRVLPNSASTAANRTISARNMPDPLLVGRL